jgi:hypothetical protein
MKQQLQAFWKNKKNETLIVLALSGFILVGLLCWLCFSKTENFGLNFFTNMLGVTVTIFVIDRLIKNREEARSIPQKLAAYEDVRLYTSRYISFWTNVYRESVPEEEPDTLEIFFSEAGMTKILDYLYMDSEPNVYPSRKWYNWIAQNAKEFKENGDKLLDRYSHNLDPIAFGYVHQLTESFFNNALSYAPMIRQSDSFDKTPRPQVLGSYVFLPPKEDYEAIIGLVKWCDATYHVLKKHRNSINKIEYFTIKNRIMPPKCMIPKEILEQQIKEFNEFQQRNKSLLRITDLPQMK